MSASTPSSSSAARLNEFKNTAAFVYVLVGLLAVQPLTSDLYLPSLPSLSAAFAAPKSLVTWTLSAQVGTFGITQLFMGPLSDRFGRRPVAIAGLIIYFIASLVAMFAPVIEVLILCRCLQGLGVACAFVTCRAMVRDLFAPLEGARVLARGLMVMSFAPIAGPFVGGLLTAQFGWQGPFVALASFSAALLLLVGLSMPESNAQLNPLATRLAPLLRNYGTILRHPLFIVYALLSLLSYGGLFAFLSGSSFVFIQIFGFSSTLYGLAFGCTGIGYFLGTRLAIRLIAKRGVVGAVQIGAALSLSAGLCLLALALANVHHPLAVLLPCVGYVFAHGCLQPCAQSACMAPFPQMAGAASALNGFTQMAMAVFVGIWMGKSFDGSTLPLAITMCAFTVCIALTGWLLVRRYGQLPQH